MAAQLSRFSVAKAEELRLLDGELQALATQAFADVRGVPAPRVTAYSAVPEAIRDAVRAALGAGLSPDLPWSSSQPVNPDRRIESARFDGPVLDHSDASDTDELPLILRCKRARREDSSHVPARPPTEPARSKENVPLSELPIDDLFRLISGLDPEMPLYGSSRSSLGVAGPAVGADPVATTAPTAAACQQAGPKRSPKRAAGAKAAPPAALKAVQEPATTALVDAVAQPSHVDVAADNAPGIQQPQQQQHHDDEHPDGAHVRKRTPLWLNQLLPNRSRLKPAAPDGAPPESERPPATKRPRRQEATPAAATSAAVAQPAAVNLPAATQQPMRDGSNAVEPQAQPEQRLQQQRSHPDDHQHEGQTRGVAGASASATYVDELQHVVPAPPQPQSQLLAGASLPGENWVAPKPAEGRVAEETREHDRATAAPQGPGPAVGGCDAPTSSRGLLQERACTDAGQPDETGPGATAATDSVAANAAVSTPVSITAQRASSAAVMMPHGMQAQQSRQQQQPKAVTREEGAQPKPAMIFATASGVPVAAPETDLAPKERRKKPKPSPGGPPTDVGGVVRTVAQDPAPQQPVHGPRQPASPPKPQQQVTSGSSQPVQTENPNNGSQGPSVRAEERAGQSSGGQAAGLAAGNAPRAGPRRFAPTVPVQHVGAAGRHVVRPPVPTDVGASAAVLTEAPVGRLSAPAPSAFAPPHSAVTAADPLSAEGTIDGRNAALGSDTARNPKPVGASVASGVVGARRTRAMPAAVARAACADRAAVDADAGERLIDVPLAKRNGRQPQPADQTSTPTAPNPAHGVATPPARNGAASVPEANAATEANAAAAVKAAQELAAAKAAGRAAAQEAAAAKVAKEAAAERAAAEAAAPKAAQEAAAAKAAEEAAAAKAAEEAAAAKAAEEAAAAKATQQAAAAKAAQGATAVKAAQGATVAKAAQGATAAKAGQGATAAKAGQEAVANFAQGDMSRRAAKAGAKTPKENATAMAETAEKAVKEEAAEHGVSASAAADPEPALPVPQQSAGQGVAARCPATGASKPALPASTTATQPLKLQPAFAAEVPSDAEMSHEQPRDHPATAAPAGRAASADLPKAARAPPCNLTRLPSAPTPLCSAIGGAAAPSTSAASIPTAAASAVDAVAIQSGSAGAHPPGKAAHTAAPGPAASGAAGAHEAKPERRYKPVAPVRRAHARGAPSDLPSTHAELAALAAMWMAAQKGSSGGGAGEKGGDAVPTAAAGSAQVAVSDAGGATVATGPVAEPEAAAMADVTATAVPAAAGVTDGAAAEAAAVRQPSRDSADMLSRTGKADGVAAGAPPPPPGSTPPPAGDSKAPSSDQPVPVTAATPVGQSHGAGAAAPAAPGAVPLPVAATTATPVASGVHEHAGGSDFGEYAPAPQPPSDTATSPIRAPAAPAQDAAACTEAAVAAGRNTELGGKRRGDERVGAEGDGELSRRNSSGCGSGAEGAEGEGERSGTEGPDGRVAAGADGGAGGGGQDDEGDADMSPVEREEWRRRRAEIERQRAEAAAEREAARRARIAANAAAGATAELERRIRQRLADHHQLATAAAAEAAAKEDIRTRIRDSLQERFRKALDEHSLTKLLRQLDVVPKGTSLRTAEQRNKALKAAKIRFHPDKVTGSLEDRVYAEEVSKLLNSWAWTK